MMYTPIPKLVTSVAIPTTISQLITIIYNTCDTYFVSQIGTSAAAAVGVVLALMSVIQAVGFGIGMGANSLISRKLGAKNDKEAYKYGNSALLAAAIFGLFLMIVGLLFTERFMKILGSTKTIMPYACSYGRYIFIAAPVMCSSFVLNNILRSEGDTLFAMWGLCVGGILNAILDPVFIFYFNIEISGAAIATVISQLVSFILLLSVFISNKSIVKLNPRYISNDIRDYILIIKNGIPTICRQMLGSVSAALLNIQAAFFGDSAVAAITIANKIYMLVRNVILGIGQEFQPVAGYNYGSGNKKRVRESFIFVVKTGTIICIIASILIAFNASVIITWFRKDDLEVIHIGTKALYFACTVMPFMAYSTYVNQMYQCIGFSKQATFLASLRQGLCFVPLILLLPIFGGLSGVAMSQPVSDFLTFVISVPFQIKFFKNVLGVRAEG